MSAGVVEVPARLLCLEKTAHFCNNRTFLNFSPSKKVCVKLGFSSGTTKNIKNDSLQFESFSVLFASWVPNNTELVSRCPYLLSESLQSLSKHA